MTRCPGPTAPTLPPPDRRDFLRRAGGGFGLIALTPCSPSNGCSRETTRNRQGGRTTAPAPSA